MKIDCFRNPRLASYGCSTRTFPFLGDLMPIRIRHPDMTIASMQQPDISLVMPDAVLVRRHLMLRLKRCLGCYANQYKQCSATKTSIFDPKAGIDLTEK
jgi:hypothetical protein